jgi:hypothetical protein
VGEVTTMIKFITDGKITYQLEDNICIEVGMLTEVFGYPGVVIQAIRMYEDTVKYYVEKEK